MISEHLDAVYTLPQILRGLTAAAVVSLPTLTKWISSVFLYSRSKIFFKCLCPLCSIMHTVPICITLCLYVQWHWKSSFYLNLFIPNKWHFCRVEDIRPDEWLLCVAPPFLSASWRSSFWKPLILTIPTPIYLTIRSDISISYGQLETKCLPPAWKALTKHGRVEEGGKHWYWEKGKKKKKTWRVKQG